MFKEKLKASLMHLSLSILLVALSIGTTIFFLFPMLFINVTDFKEVASIIISVDLVLGPLLTFVVFNPKKAKKLLYLDFAFIAVIQLFALGYGAYSLFQIHPVYVAFNVDRFTIVTAKDAEPEKAKLNEFKVSKFTAAKLVFAKMPEDLDKQNDLVFSAAAGGDDLDRMEEYYEPIEDNISEILAKKIDPDLIFKNDKIDPQAKKFLDDNQEKLQDFVFLPLNSQKKEAIIVLNKSDGEPVVTLDIDPWKISKNNK